MSNPDRIEIADSPISLWLVTEASGRQYTIHRHQVASNVAQDPGVKVHALTLVATEAAAMAATVPALRDALLQISAKAQLAADVCESTPNIRKVFEILRDAATLALSQAPVAGQPAEPSPAKPWEYSKIEKRIQELMAGAGLPNSMSVAQAMMQLVNELHHEYGPPHWPAPKGDSNG